ncbi:major facilitator superfamily domain-containing protein [Lasiosphaeris hirsuta]|uniref:Major facilitator superfamily domain-containing protein n=1 Tax=Lasiosphaeris hirsuta TaxID=260670 RepID=A0AA39ZPN7_9PEZI|nr:major facilitator superfamily domain-containing protein [Lasiosphaeris hirsuta]
MTRNTASLGSPEADVMPATAHHSTPTTGEGSMPTAPREGGSEADAETPGALRTRVKTALLVGALGLALFLAALDTTIISTIVPTVAEEFQSGLGYTWVGSAYLLACAAWMPTWGKISDIFGRKSVLLLSVAIFLVGSLLCGLAVSMAILIAARAVQGVGAGGVFTLVYVCISDLFSVRQRGLYFGAMGMVWVLASAVGPVLGGFFADRVTWRWCFYINLPTCGLGLVVLPVVLDLHNPRTPIRDGLKAIDWVGSTATIGFSGAYMWRFATHPLIPLHLLASRSNCAALATAFFHGFVLISASYWLPLYLQAVAGASPLQSGVYLLPYALSLSLTSAVGGWLMKKTGRYVPMIVGAMVITVLGFGLLLIAGAGIGPNSQAPLIALQTTVEPQDMASVTSMFAFMRQMATAISIMVGGIVFSDEMQKQYQAISAQGSPDLVNALSSGRAVASVSWIADLPADEANVARQAYHICLRQMRVVYTVFAGAGLVSSLFISHLKLSRDHQDHRTGLETLRRRIIGPAEPGREGP